MTAFTRSLAVALVAAAPAALAENRLLPYGGVAVEEVYDSAPLNSLDPDVVTRVTPRVGALVHGPRLRAGADARVALHKYVVNDGQDTVNYRAAAFAEGALSRRVEASAALVAIRAEDPVLLSRSGVLIPNTAFTDIEATARLDGRATRRLDVGGSYMYRRTRFDEGGAGELAFDSDEHRLDVRSSWRADRTLTLTAAGRGQVFVAFDASSRVATALAPVAGVELRATRRLLLAADAGPAWFLPGGDVTYVGTARASMTGRSARLSLSGVRDIFGGTGASTASFGEAVRLDLAVRVSRRAAVALVAGVGRTGPAQGGDADVSTLVGRAELRWALLSRHLLLDLYAEGRQQDATGALGFGDVSRTLVGVKLTLVAGARADVVAGP